MLREVGRRFTKAFSSTTIMGRRVLRRRVVRQDL